MDFEERSSKRSRLNDGGDNVFLQRLRNTDPSEWTAEFLESVLRNPRHPPELIRTSYTGGTRLQNVTCVFRHPLGMEVTVRLPVTAVSYVYRSHFA